MSEWSNDVIERQRQAENTTHILMYLLNNYDDTFINNNDNTFRNITTFIGTSSSTLSN